ncbi:uncharacterized protein JCM6883_000459 [Sporobolomyces salmoneus]|uniref:uncharacterized protein n=1 Tax=Sporobolomyces salmoneus TaxID=183962 RepID=UPI003175CF14
MPKHPLTCLRFKLAKTTIFLPVTSSSTLSSLRQTLLSALEFSSSDASAPELEFSELGELPKKASDIALWRLEPSAVAAAGEEGGAEESWIRLTDEKSTADKLGLREAEEVGVSFKSSDGDFPLPTVVRPKDDYEEGMEEE